MTITAKDLQSKTKNNAEWAWARGAANVGQVEDAVEAVEAVLKKNPFFLEYILCTNVKELKKTHGASYHKLLKQLASELGDPVQHVIDVCMRLSKMHAASIK